MSDDFDYDVFLSHNSQDKPAVEALAQRLVADQVGVFLDRWCLTPGKPWQTELKQALDRSRKVAVIIGSRPTGPWHHREMQLALQAKDDGQVIPVLLPGGDTANVPEFLPLVTWVDLGEGEIAYERLIRSIKNQPHSVPRPHKQRGRRRHLLTALVISVITLTVVAGFAVLWKAPPASKLLLLHLDVVRDHVGGPVRDDTPKEGPYVIVADGERQFVQYELINPIRPEDKLRLRGEFKEPVYWYCLLIDANGDPFVTGHSDQPSRIFWSDTTEERGYYGLEHPPAGGNVLLVLAGDRGDLAETIKNQVAGIRSPPKSAEDELGPHGHVVGDATIRDYLALVESRLGEEVSILSWLHLRNDDYAM